MDEKEKPIVVKVSTNIGSTIWAIGYLFTLGVFLPTLGTTPWWMILLAVVLWPMLLGAHFFSGM